MRRARRALSAAASVVALLGVGAFLSATPAYAASPHWAILAQAAPTDFHPGDTSDFYEVVAINDGDGVADPKSVTITDVLPGNLTVSAVHGLSRIFIDSEDMACESSVVGANPVVSCTPPEETALRVGAEIILKINVEVALDAAGILENVATISGGGAPQATTESSAPLTPSAQPVPYGASISTDIAPSDGGGAALAGSHPAGFASLVAFNVGATAPGYCVELPICGLGIGNTKDVEVELPPGLVGNPTTLPTCSQAEFGRQTNLSCPADTQVGYISLRFYGGNGNQEAPVYNIEPPEGQPAEFGFGVGGGVAHIPMFFHLRSDGDYGLTADLSEVNEYSNPRFAVLSIWGVPADPVHDFLRRTIGCNNGCASDGARRPLLTLPTRCSGEPLSVPMFTSSWQEPNRLAAAQPAMLPAMTGCNGLHFEPALEARPTTNLADSPSGLHVDIHVPQPESLEGLAEAHLRDAVVSLPRGLTVNPAAAAGRVGCAPAQFGLTSAEGATPIRTTGAPAQCPDAAKLGTVEVDTPLLKEHNEAGEADAFHPLLGSVYLASPYDNPFKSLLALYIAVSDPKTGVVVKLAGQVHIAPDGRLTTTVQENPQLPFEDFKLDFFGGARAPLRTPATCGEYKTTSELTPWSAPESGPPATPSDPYQISSGPNGHACASTEAAEPNQPSFEAGTEKPLAGAFSPFALHLHREDGSQVFKALNVTMPPGLVGKLAGVGECSDSALATAASKSGAAEQASPSCPASSKLGTATVGAGAGTSPYYVGGTAYLAGPYKSAPLSVAIVTPALAGPFDLGTVVVRSALHVNPETAQVSVTSDPIPGQLQGIQLDIRQVDLKLDRSQFTLNPTNCERMAVDGEEISSLNQTAQLANPFQVGGCARLGFKPKLAISLKGGTRRTKHPALRAVVTYPKKGDYANIASAQVTLPHSAFLDQSHIGTVCTRVQFAAHACPPASVYGHARAITPLLDHPLEGPVYLRSSSHKLPDLVAALNGQISVDLAGKVDTGKGGGIRNTFEVVPDAPVSKFVLSMRGGSKGLLVNSENICKKPQKALAHFVAQNGKVSDTTPLISNDCKSGHGKKKGRH